MGKTEFIIGITGHRDISISSIPTARKQVDALFDQLALVLPDTPLRLLSGLADGADRLVAQAAIDKGIAVDATLPMPLDNYKDDFSEDSFEELQELLALPLVSEIVIETDQPLNDRDQAYGRLSSLLYKRCSLLITLWDGVPSALAGGTADTLTRFLNKKENNSECEIEWVDKLPEGATTNSYAYWVPVGRGKDDVTSELSSCYVSGLTGLDYAIKQSELPKPLHEELKHLNDYNVQLEKMGNDVASQLSWGLNGDMEEEQLKPRQKELKAIEAEYHKADALAIWFQAKSDKVFKIYSISAGIMGLAFLIYAKIVAAKIFLLIYLGIFLFGYLSYRWINKRHWFSKHLMYRLIAEALRTKYYLTLAGLGEEMNTTTIAKALRSSNFSGFSWVSHVFRTLEKNTVHKDTKIDDQADWLTHTTRIWIDDQAGYFSKKTQQLHHAHHRVEKTKSYLLMGLFVAGIALLFFKYQLVDVILAGDLNAKTFIVFLMGLLPLWLGIWEIYAAKMAIKELSWQYTNQGALFAHAKLLLNAAKTDEERKEIFSQLASESLAETYMWVVQRVHREHEAPTAG